jgi:hypothetical protein
VIRHIVPTPPEPAAGVPDRPARADQPRAVQRGPLKLVQPGADRSEPGGINRVHAPGPFRLVRHETRGFQNLEVVGHGGSTDRQAVREGANRPWAAGQPLEEGAAGRIGQSSQRACEVSPHGRSISIDPPIEAQRTCWGGGETDLCGGIWG